MLDPAAQDALLDVDTHLRRVRHCARTWRGDPLPTATPKDQRYPLVYPRDTALLARVYDRLDRLDAVPADRASAALRGAASFLLHVQADDGHWGQRYDLDGNDRSIYRQEDNTAHAVATLARHLLHARERSADGASPLEDAAFAAIDRGLDAARRLRDDELGLQWSTTSVHESRVETGWTLWTNGAHVAALRLAADAARAAGKHDKAQAWTREREALEASLRRHLVHGGRYVRRLTPDCEVDERADITLLAPSVFGFVDLDPDAEAASVEHLEDELWDRDLGLLKRYPPQHDDLGIHLHGGDGPYLSFSSWLAQRHAERGDASRARDVLDRIVGYATRDGDLPEHVATRDQFTRFLETEWLSGLDLRKEFDPETLLDDVPQLAILDEASRMTSAYAHALEEADRAGDDVVRLAFPHAWTHGEVALAIALLEDAQGRKRASSPAQAARRA